MQTSLQRRLMGTRLETAEPDRAGVLEMPCRGVGGEEIQGILRLRKNDLRANALAALKMTRLTKIRMRVNVPRPGAWPGGRAGWRRRCGPARLSDCRACGGSGRFASRCRTGQKRRASHRREVVPPRRDCS